MLLAPYTTLRIGGPARYFAEIENEQELSEGLTFAKVKPSGLPIFVLGGGSNILVSDKGFDGLVIRPMIMGREVISPPIPSPYNKGRAGEEIRIRVGAGEVLDDVIGWTVENGWWGLENLSFIPGLTGALAIQNVGAYGTEASEVIESVEVFDRANNDLRIMSNEECGFEYRRSRFNTTDKNKFIILRVLLKLKKNGRSNLSYEDVKSYFGNRLPAGKTGIPKLIELRNAIIEIRKNKGQDPNEIWSAGSFFKNFVVCDNEGVEYKISAAEILDKRLGLKGLQVGGAKLSEKQVINMVNTGNATARDCIELFERVRAIVLDKTGLKLVNEPEFVGFE